MTRYRCAILDDFQNVALSLADWSKLSDEVETTVFNSHLGGADKVIAALKGFDIVCMMRERTPFPRAVIEALPDLKLLITTGAKNNAFDVKAANERAVGDVGGEIAKREPPDARFTRVLSAAHHSMLPWFHRHALGRFATPC